MIPDRVNQMSPLSLKHFGLANASFVPQLVHRHNELSVANKSLPSNVDSSLATNQEFPPTQSSVSLQFMNTNHTYDEQWHGS